jgi:hypothetical protein
MTAHNHTGWALTLNREQRRAIRVLRRRHSQVGQKNAKTDGWFAYIQPTTGPAKYLELRHYLLGGGVARWVIERDGTVSATNNLGVSPNLVPTEDVPA